MRKKMLRIIMTITEKEMSDVKYIFHKWPSCVRIG